MDEGGRGAAGSDEVTVAVQHVSKLYRLYSRPSDRLFELLPFLRERRHADFWALRDVSLAVGRGEAVGIVGPNGSGKSTLLQIVSGIVQPSSGRVLARGRVAALLELGAGFNPEFTGRENLFLNGEIMGLSRNQVERAFPSVAAFAEIGEFIDRPVREYSSGMYVRLAFSIAIHVEPEILVIDEVLAVGDAIFANRCLRRLEEMKSAGVTVIFVSHDLSLVKRMADRAVFLLNGRIEAQGCPGDVTNRYVALVHERQGETAPAEANGSGSIDRHGDGASRIVDVAMMNQRGERTASVGSGERVIVRLAAVFERGVEQPTAGLLIRNRLGIDVCGTNTRVEQKELGSFRPGDRLEVEFAFDCLLTRGEYTLTVAMQHWDGRSQDWRDDLLAFTVTDSRDLAGLADLRTAVAWRRA